MPTRHATRALVNQFMPPAFAVSTMESDYSVNMRHHAGAGGAPAHAVGGFGGALTGTQGMTYGSEDNEDNDDAGGELASKLPKRVKREWQDLDGLISKVALRPRPWTLETKY